MRWVFWASVALIAYTYVGYVVWLWLCARLRPRPVNRAAQEPTVSIVMVVRNEESVIERKLHNLLELDYPPGRCQIVVVSDGSTDGTEAILRKYSCDPRIHVILNQLPQGKASGLNDAMGLVQGDVVVFTDARQKIESGAIRRLTENLADPEVGCVSGELMLGDPESGEAAQGMGLYWRIEKQIRELESASGSVVGATGALYAARRTLLVPVPPDTILDDVFLPLHVARRGARVIFDQRARAWDSPDLGARREFRRKVRTLTGNYQLVQIAPWLLGGENPLRFRFISHKLLRLVVPFALSTTLLTSMALPQPFYRAAFLLQLFFYGFSIFALTGAQRGPVARVANAALTLIVLNTAAVVAFTNFLTGRKEVWVR